MDDIFNLLEWPAMAISLVAAYLLDGNTVETGAYFRMARRVIDASGYRLPDGSVHSELLGAISPTKRIIAFVMLIVGNVRWIGWGWGNDAKALIALNVGLMVLNIRGVFKNEEAKEEQPAAADKEATLQ